MLSCGDLSSSQPQTWALTAGTWVACSVLCADASPRTGPAASSGLWVAPEWPWWQGALSRRAAFLPSHNRQRLAFVLSGAAMGRMEVLYWSSGKSPHSWVFAVPGKDTVLGLHAKYNVPAATGENTGVIQ